MAGEMPSRVPAAVMAALLGAAGGGLMGAGGVSLNQAAGDFFGGDDIEGYTPDEKASLIYGALSSGALMAAMGAAGSLMGDEEGYDFGQQGFFGNGPSDPGGPRPYRPGDFAVPMDQAVQYARVRVV